MTSTPSQSAGKDWQDQYIRAIEQKARLLLNLKYSKADTVRRIKADLAWEFDADINSTPLPRFYKDVSKLVQGVYDFAESGGKKSKKSRKK